MEEETGPDLFTGKEETHHNLVASEDSTLWTPATKGVAPLNCKDEDNNWGYNSSMSSSADELARIKSRVSSRGSSFSSIPESVVVKKSGSSDVGSEDGADTRRRGKPYYGLGKLRKRSLYCTAGRETSSFRKTSSVKGMQMQTENEDSDAAVVTRARHRSHRAPKSMKRSYYSQRSGKTTGKEHITEYPLILLHCNLLPPTLSLPAGLRIRDQRILQDALPPRYWRRWKVLEEKVGFGVVRDRGVLISHPQDMYDLLEERLLESLELQRPRLQGGHFIPAKTDTDEEEDTTTDDGEEQGYTCPDCGHRVAHAGQEEDTDDENEGNRKWEVRVLAANGLMKAGAWAAAWKEMEKVDVEVGLWLPSDVREELERRAIEEQSNNNISRVAPLSPSPCPGRYSSSSSSSSSSPPSSTQDMLTQDQIDGLDSLRPYWSVSKDHKKQRGRAADIDLSTLLKNYARVLATDKRNIAILLLSVVVVLFTVFARPWSADRQSLSSKDIVLESSRIMKIPPTFSQSACLPDESTITSNMASSSSLSSSSSSSSLSQTAVLDTPSTSLSSPAQSAGLSDSDIPLSKSGDTMDEQGPTSERSLT